MSIKYYIERTYPYIFSIIAVVLIRYFNINFLADTSLNNALDGVVNLDSIIIGFMGAIMPIILSMKNESKFVKYVFEKDKEELFKQYLKMTIKIGIINVGLTILMYLRNSILNIYMNNLLYYGWLFSIILFLLLTMRSMSYMITLFFSKDELDFQNKESTANKTYTDEEHEAIKKKYKN